MLKKIVRIANTGLLHNAVGAKHTLARGTLVFAENGRGKTTLAELLNSLSTGDTRDVAARATIDGTLPPTAELLFDDGGKTTVSKLSATGWSVIHSEITVFDSTFVERNVYSGQSVGPDHRQNLLEFALGASAVAEKAAVEASAKRVAELNQQISEKEKLLAVHAQGATHTTFLALPEVPGADTEIQSLRDRISAAKAATALQMMPLPQEVTLPTLDVESFFSILHATLDKLQSESEAAVEAHLATCSKPGFESWIGSGVTFDNEATCPYCGQPTTGILLVRAYRAHFDRAYRDHEDRVRTLRRGVEARLGDATSERVCAALEAAVASVTGWKLHIPALELSFDCEKIRHSLRRLANEFMAYAIKKETSPLEIVAQDGMSSAMASWGAIMSTLETYNAAIREAASAILTYRATLAGEDARALEQQVATIQLCVRRHTAEVVQLLSDLDKLRSDKKRAEKDKSDAKVRLDTALGNTLAGLQSRINDLLGKFGASFSIERLGHDYKGTGRPRSDYVLRLRSTDVGLGQKSGPHFGNVLSEGDKRTLAFSFFVATVSADPDLAKKIVVIDDPICSLDLHRRTASRRCIREIVNRATQVIVLAHDPYFLRDLRDDLLDFKPPTDCVTIQITRAAQMYSDFKDLDLDAHCASAYYKNHKLVSGYVDDPLTSDPRSVAVAIRPLLEGYMHRRFPGHISRRKLFGAIVVDAQASAPPSPLVYLKPLSLELHEINEYAGRFHHDTNPAADTADLSDTELLAYARRALSVIHKGTL